jgi:hypothetical protein
MKTFYISLLFILFPIRSFSQEAKLSEVIITIAEEMAVENSDPGNVTLYIEKLQELAENPVKINSSGEEEISRLIFLSDFQIKALADYAHSSGKIISAYEIANIPGFDKETVEMMIPFISLDNRLKINSDSAKWRNTLLTNLSDKPGSDATSSIGSSLKVLTKYKFTSGGFSGGFTIEKDQGEKLLSGNPPLPDFFSGYIAYNSRRFIRRIIVGDYSARFGQGTNINSGIRTGLSLTSPGYMSARNEIRQYTSTDENNFFRGIAADFSIKNLGLTLFYSKKFSDATLGSSSGTSNDYVENFYTSGLHTSSSEILKKDAITDFTYGINMSYNFNNIRFGIAWSEDRLSLPVKPSADVPEEVFDFSGKRNSIYTIYYNSLIKRILLFGEFSANDNFRKAFIQGLSFRPSDRLSLNFLYRKYDTGYFSLHGNGPGSSSATVNEQGILGNFIFEAAKHLFIFGGCNIQQFPWLKYRNSSPSRGIKKEVMARFLPTEKIVIEALFNNRLATFDSVSTGIPKQAEITTRNIRGSIRYTLNNNLIIGTRIDYKLINSSGSKGIMMLQDISYRFRKIPVTLWFRYCIFNTDDWNSRIYAYENDLLYSFSIPALSGEGSRSYIMVKWEIGDFADIRFKYSITSLAVNGTSSEDLNEIKFQIKILF